MIFAGINRNKCSKLAESEDTQQHPLTPSFLGSNPSTPAQGLSEITKTFFCAFAGIFLIENDMGVLCAL